jgi:cell division protein FtsL
MKLGTILLVFLILAAVGVAVASAKADGAGDSTGQQVQSENQTQDQLRDRQRDGERNEPEERLENRTQEGNRTHEQLGELRLQNQTQAMNLTVLRQQIQERKLEQEQEWRNLSAEQRNVNARYSNVSAFVHLLLNESRAEALLGNRSGGIGPQVSLYARECNTSVTAQIQAEERMESRNGFVRFIAGGDDEAVAALDEEA